METEATIEERLAKLELRCDAYEDTLRLIDTAFGALADSQQHSLNHSKLLRRMIQVLADHILVNIDKEDE